MPSRSQFGSRNLGDLKAAGPDEYTTAHVSHGPLDPRSSDGHQSTEMLLTSALRAMAARRCGCLLLLSPIRSVATPSLFTGVTRQCRSRTFAPRLRITDRSRASACVVGVIRTANLMVSSSKTAGLKAPRPVICRSATRGHAVALPRSSAYRPAGQQPGQAVSLPHLRERR